jgi:hypothetical protein
MEDVEEIPRRIFSLVQSEDGVEFYVQEGPCDVFEFEQDERIWARTFAGGMALVSRLRCPVEKDSEVDAFVLYPEKVLVQCLDVAVRRGLPQVAYRAAWQLGRQNHALLAARVVSLILMDAVYHPVSDVVAWLALAWGLTQKAPTYEEVKLLACVSKDMAQCPRAEHDSVLRMCLLQREDETIQQKWRRDGPRALRCDPTFGVGVYLLGECVERLDKYWSGATGEESMRRKLYDCVRRWSVRFEHPVKGDDWHELVCQCYPTYPEAWWEAWFAAYPEGMEPDDCISEASNDVSAPEATEKMVTKARSRADAKHVRRRVDFENAIAELRRRRSEKKAISEASTYDTVLVDWQKTPVRAAMPHLFAAWEVLQPYLDPSNKSYAYPDAWKESEPGKRVAEKERITAYFQPNRKKKGRS